jgi:hypothetical protein
MFLVVPLLVKRKISFPRSSVGTHIVLELRQFLFAMESRRHSHAGAWERGKPRPARGREGLTLRLRAVNLPLLRNASEQVYLYDICYRGVRLVSLSCEPVHP